ncbi:tRNA lysidine(34) synthetase TilS [Protaetiibacter intestinalis]|uniref:tRNA(Ile)-lysidine synthase n=1 Tax=Protaetiibacter intestinalis TaxID=2419774 RepID=A0A387B9A3_9MICO|nr:tRNA lysidine(34) synthetase TilS [Protaetiibacter intestinalis]AYF97676.1 tRNA lysidine(34) synthetase TilS [Protaetiibacter intestinalis]
MASDSPRPRLTPARADIRRAVRESLADLAASPNHVENAGDSAAPRGIRGAAGASAGESPAFSTSPLVLVALSGGADSLALAAATAFEAPRAGIRAGAVVVDHGLQEGSDAVAARAAEQARALGLDPVVVTRVEVGGGGGLEAAARDARYAAIFDAVRETGARLAMTAHTLDDQAETVLLGLARGSGGGSLMGMTADAGLLRRPLLGIRRAATRQACLDEGLEPWDDPHNTDTSYARVRVRERVLPVLEAELGPGVAEALARTAEQAREDGEAFAHQIEEFIEDICEPAEAGVAVAVAALAANPAALRQRVIRYVVLAEFGVSLTRAHTLEVARLVTDWHGQGPIDLPGLTARREGPLLVFSAAG